MPTMADRWHAEGRIEGLAEGVVIGQQRGLLAMLEARGMLEDGAVQTRILLCDDSATLDRWTARAATVDDVKRLFDEPAPTNVG